MCAAARSCARQHHRGRPVPHHIPHHEPGPHPGQRDDVPPVAAHHLAGSRRGTPGDLDPAGNRRRRRDQTLLQRPAVPPVPGELGGVRDPGPGPPGQIGDGRDVGVGVRAAAAASRRHHHSGHVAGRGERHREERGVVGEKLPARGPDPLNRHRVRPAEPLRGAAGQARAVGRIHREGEYLARRQHGLDRVAVPLDEPAGQPARHDLPVVTAVPALQEEDRSPVRELRHDHFHQQPGDVGRVEGDAEPPPVAAHGAGAARGTGPHGSPGLRATPPSVSTWTGGNGAGSGRHSGSGTMPGGTRSRPSKKPAICSGVRSW